MGIYAMTGGATGIGAAIKETLISEGHQVVVIDIKDADITADLSSLDGRKTAIDELRNRCATGLEGFVACAGVASHVPNKSLLVGVNYFGATELIDGVLDLLTKKNGNVLLVSSNSAPAPTNLDFVDALLSANEKQACLLAESMEGQQVYSGGKQAIARWMRRNVSRFSAANIRINAIAPGYTQTPMTKAVEESEEYGDAIKAFMDSIPVGRPGQPEDMAQAAKFLLSDASSFVQGTILFVDGGHDAVARPDNF